MAFEVLSDVSKQYLLEENAIKGFRMAVENGQSRLALSILTDIIDVFNNIFVEVLSDDDEQNSDKKTEEVVEKVESSKTVQTNSASAATEQKETVAQKNSSKKETRLPE